MLPHCGTKGRICSDNADTLRNKGTDLFRQCCHTAEQRDGSVQTVQHADTLKNKRDGSVQTILPHCRTKGRICSDNADTLRDPGTDLFRQCCHTAGPRDGSVQTMLTHCGTKGRICSDNAATLRDPGKDLFRQCCHRAEQRDGSVQTVQHAATLRNPGTVLYPQFSMLPHCETTE